jgi:class 3 adenylate cyclase
MREAPETKFARNGDVHIAYQAIGSGPIDLLLIDSWVHHVEMVWEIPEWARVLRRLSAFARLIHFDRRGTGLSDPVPLDELPDLETQVDDAIAVLDAAGAERPAVFGVQDGTLIAMLLAAMHPDRCGSLVMYSATVGGHSWSPESIDEMVQTIVDDLAIHGGGGGVPILAPSRVDDARFVAQFARLQRASVRPGAVGHYFRRSMVSNARDVVPLIQAPTLLLHRTHDQIVPIELGRQVASLIPDARLVELPGADHLVFVGDTDALVDEIEEFLTGARSGADPDRVLATLLFTDIVGSTQKAAELGDRIWRDLLDEHHDLVRRELDRFKGRELATTGDGFLAIFDGPARAVRCALSTTTAVGPLGLEIRAGVHTGEVYLRGSDVGGLAVHVAARVAALAGPGEVLVSSSVKDLLDGSGIELEDRGEHELKGVPEKWRLFAAKSPSRSGGPIPSGTEAH